jgi:transcriptional regulator with XRE-family HTH domain
LNKKPLDTRDDPALRKAFGEALRELRLSRKISQEDLAAEANLNRSFLSGLEAGKHEPGLLTLWRLKRALNVSLSQFARAIEKHYPDEC